MTSAWPGGNPRACVPSLACGTAASLPTASKPRNAVTRTLMMIPTLRTHDGRSARSRSALTVSVEMMVTLMLPAGVRDMDDKADTGGAGKSSRRRDWQHESMAITTSSIAHVRLTVTDIERSRQIYESDFGWRVLIESPEGADEVTREALGFLFGGVIYDLGGALIGLRPVAADRFHEDRC